MYHKVEYKVINSIFPKVGDANYLIVFVQYYCTIVNTGNVVCFFKTKQQWKTADKKCDRTSDFVQLHQLLQTLL